MKDPIGCIDPHGMWPFPASREVCPKCRAIRAQRASLRHGLPFGWWKSTDFWAAAISLLCLSGLASVLFLAWFLDWKPWW